MCLVAGGRPATRSGSRWGRRGCAGAVPRGTCATGRSRPDSCARHNRSRRARLRRRHCGDHGGQRGQRRCRRCARPHQAGGPSLPFLAWVGPPRHRASRPAASRQPRHAACATGTRRAIAAVISVNTTFRDASISPRGRVAAPCLFPTEDRGVEEASVARRTACAAASCFALSPLFLAIRGAEHAYWQRQNPYGEACWTPGFETKLTIGM